MASSMTTTRTGRAPVVSTSEQFAELLHELSGIAATPTQGTFDELDRLLAQVGPSTVVEKLAIQRSFYGRLNIKLMRNSDRLSEIYGAAAAEGVTFNYHAKKAIAWAVHSGDQHAYAAALQRYCPENVRAPLLDRFSSAPFQETRAALFEETHRPSKLRKALLRQVEEDVVDAAAGCLVWSLWSARVLRQYFDSYGDEHALADDFLTGLRGRSPELFERRRSLVVRKVSSRKLPKDYEGQRRQLTSWLADEYDALDNYGHLALHVVLDGGDPGPAWELAADLTLFGERFHEHPSKMGYFRWRDVERETREHIPELDPSEARFDVVNEGFTYRDLFVLHGDGGVVERLLLLFQKNRRDETLVPCPTCRSTNVRGNSYPSFGVKSWECRNRLCPDRSIYNRGKRYSFKGLITQEAIENPANLIPVESVRRWRRDVLQDVAERELSEMLLRHYSIAGDVVVLIDTDQPAASYGRSVVVEEPSRRRAKSTFWSGPFFARYGLGARNAGAPQLTQPAPQSDWSIEEGDSRHVLARIDSNTFDLGVTSPPYFNAREYSQWPNIYCYMYDMAAVHEQVLRVLKPGAVYAFNVFDYFDNERTITFSAMGQKRLSLSALFVDLFRRIGFRLVGNLVWDKGDVEGKRAFNAGNFSPFYQSPLNCWEHVLLFQKPGIDCPPTRIVGDRVLPIKPVVKMVRGENRLGHSAPFPQQLPEALMASLSPGSFVLDPFGGSGTTARAGITMGMRTLLVEQSHDYVKLARSLTEKYEADLLQREAQLRLV